MTVKLADDLYVAVHGADLDDYGAMILAAEDGVDRAVRAVLVPARRAPGISAGKPGMWVRSLGITTTVSDVSLLPVPVLSPQGCCISPVSSGRTYTGRAELTRYRKYMAPGCPHATLPSEAFSGPLKSMPPGGQ